MINLSINEALLIIGIMIMFIGMVIIIASNPRKYIVGITEYEPKQVMTEEQAIQWQMAYDLQNKLNK